MRGTVEVDARPGGRYRFTMRDPSGSAHTVVGEYREITPPERLAYTWLWEDGPPETEASADFARRRRVPRGRGRTKVVLTHTGFTNGAIRDDHEQGWTAVSRTSRASSPNGRAAGSELLGRTSTVRVQRRVQHGRGDDHAPGDVEGEEESRGDAEHAIRVRAFLDEA
jgi:glutathione S-transferase